MKPTPNLKVVTTPSPDRAALAEAIAYANAASRNLDQALTAKQNAEARVAAAWAEQERLQEIERTKSYASQPRGHVIEAMADGAEVETLDRVGELKRELADVAREIEKWRDLRDLASQEIDARQTMLEQAQRKVTSAANSVVVSTIDVAALIKETSAAQDIVVANRARLRQLLDLAPDGPEREQVSAFLGIGWLAIDWERHPATDRLRAFREDLLRDADATAPGK